MPTTLPAKPGSLKDPALSALFSTKDPEQRFEDLREIGHGSFGAVFYAQDRETNETVAVKKMAFYGKQAIEKWSDIIKEVSFLKEVSHKNIVDYRACYLKEHTCWLVMEYCIGSAADIVEVHRRPLREIEIAAIIQQTLCGLEYLHNAGRIHRDVKAGNILLTDTGIVKLADFGSASVISPAQSFVGTPYWMAPEVILAMDEGHYDTSADIWSLGITCIELAERKPPLFNMNAMSALYHIAQNDPPSLSMKSADGTPQWSEDFKSFLDGCLKKNPNERMSTTRCREHRFVKVDNSENVLLELIARTKALVSDLDNFQYRKMRKLIYLDEQQLCAGIDSNSLSEKTEIEDDYLPVGGSTSSRSNSVSSYQSLHSDLGALSERSNGRKSRPPIPSHMMATPTTINDDEEFRDENRTVIRVGDEDTSLSELSSQRSECSLARDGLHGFSSASSIQESTSRPLNEVASIRKSKFETLRTTKLISKEMEEHSRENNIYEQMSGYKRLRQQHQKELKQMEERCAVAMEALTNRMAREYEQLASMLSKELQRTRNNHIAEKERKSREHDDIEKKLRRHMLSQQETELKNFINMQKKEYKQKKEKAKLELKERFHVKTMYENAMKEEKSKLSTHRSDAEAMKARELKIAFDAEIRRLRRDRMISLQTLSERLTNEDLDLQSKQLECNQEMSRKHLEMTTKLELEQLADTHRLRKRHLKTQHEAETTNQIQYNQRVTEELAKRHALQSKQQPKELKAKELLIRKQYRQAVKTQLRQSKILQAQVLSTVPKEQHREVIAKLKNEQKRKLALLATQYERTIESMVQNQTVKLESWQVDEAKCLREKLEKELSMLEAFQNKQKSDLENTCKKEQEQLMNSVAMRKDALEEKLENERSDFEKERKKVLSALEEKHKNEVEAFEDPNRLSSFEAPSLSSASSSHFSSLSGFRALSSSLHSLTTS